MNSRTRNVRNELSELQRIKEGLMKNLPEDPSPEDLFNIMSTNRELAWALSDELMPYRAIAQNHFDSCKRIFDAARQNRPTLAMYVRDPQTMETLDNFWADRFEAASREWLMIQDRFQAAAKTYKKLVDLEFEAQYLRVDGKVRDEPYGPDMSEEASRIRELICESNDLLSVIVECVKDVVDPHHLPSLEMIFQELQRQVAFLLSQGYYGD